MARDRRRSDLAKFVKAYQDLGAPAGGPAEQAVWVVLARHGTKEGATKASKALWRRFVNPNELRVAKATEIASLIQRHVKNEPIRVAEEVRGFLRRFHKDHHTIDFAVTEEMTPDQIRKYLSGAEGYVKEMALALFIHYCRKEIEQEAAEAAEGDAKAKKRGEREVTTAAEKLRLLAATAAAGTVVAKTKQTAASRNFAKAWSYAPLSPVERAAASPARSQSATQTASKSSKAKGGGAARPKTTRTTRKRTTKKSSRR